MWLAIHNESTALSRIAMHGAPKPCRDLCVGFPRQKTRFRHSACVRSACSFCTTKYCSGRSGLLSPLLSVVIPCLRSPSSWQCAVLQQLAFFAASSLVVNGIAEIISGYPWPRGQVQSIPGACTEHKYHSPNSPKQKCSFAGFSRLHNNERRRQEDYESYDAIAEKENSARSSAKFRTETSCILRE